MVTVVFEKLRLLRKCGVSENDLEALLFDLKSEMKSEGGMLEVEVNADRPDLLSSDGVARAVRGLTGKAVGEAKYEATDSGYTIIVERVVQRPYVAAAIVEGVKLGEEGLRELIQFQEKLHVTIGRRRRKVAIGIHDLTKIDTKIIKYSTIPLDYKFVPLGGEKPLTLSEILYGTEQGLSYGQISLAEGKLPAILQEDDQVLSVPPVINSEKTRLTSNTTDLFIDVTGTSAEAVGQTLDIISTNLAEGGGKIKQVKVIKGNWNSTPILHHGSVSAKLDYISSVSGHPYTCEEARNLLAKARLDSICDSDTLQVITPPYRIDLLGRADVVEELLMMKGYSNLTPSPHIITTTGSLSIHTSFIRALRDLAIGAGFIEVFNFVLTDHRDFKGNALKLTNPVTTEVNSVRTSLIPGILRLLSKNQNVGFPIKIFEIGDIVLRDVEKDTGYTNRTMMVLAIMDSKVSFEQLQGPIHAIIKALGTAPSYTRYDNSYFLEGRGAKIHVDDDEVGVIGELHPRELEYFGISFPVLIAELSVDELLRLQKGG